MGDVRGERTTPRKHFRLSSIIAAQKHEVGAGLRSNKSCHTRGHPLRFYAAVSDNGYMSTDYLFVHLVHFYRGLSLC